LIDIDPGTRTSISGGGGNVGVHPHILRVDPAQAFVDVAVLNEKAPGGMMLAGDFILTQDDFGRTFWYHFRTPQNRVELIGPRRDTVKVSILDHMPSSSCASCPYFILPASDGVANGLNFGAGNSLKCPGRQQLHHHR